MTVAIIILNIAQFVVALIAALSSFASNKKRKLLAGSATVAVLILACQIVIARLQSEDTKRLHEEADSLRADLTGGDAYPEVVPQVFVAPLRFTIFNRGKSPLQNVSVSLRRIDFRGEPSDSVFLGSIPVGGNRDLPFRITPIIDANSPYVDDRRIDSWIIDMSATNGMFEQRIDFRRTKACEAVWETRSTFLWKQSEPSKIIKRATDFWSLNLLGTCH